MVYNQNTNAFASSGVGTAALTTGIIGTLGTALMTGILGPGGLFGGARAIPDTNPASSAVYQLAQKDTVIAKLEAERDADRQFNLVQAEFGNIKQRLAAMEAAAPLREKILVDGIAALQANLSNISGYMVKASALPETAEAA